MTDAFHMIVALAILMIILAVNLLRVHSKVEQDRKQAEEKLEKLKLGAELWSDALEFEKRKHFQQAKSRMDRIMDL